MKSDAGNMRALSLFSGCGGLDLAAEMAGIEVVGQCEIDKACNKVLLHWWPDVPRWEDIHDVTADDVRDKCGAVDLVFGGPPCQPVSVAGRRKAAGDERNMWPEFIRTIRDIRPRWVVAENPTGILSAQKIKGDEREWPKGEFFGEIVREITALGYSVGWGVWGACDVGAPHKRERVFVVGYRPLENPNSIGRFRKEVLREQSRGTNVVCPSESSKLLAYRDSEREPQSGRDIEEGRGWSGDGGQGLADSTSGGLSISKHESGVAKQFDGIASKQPCATASCGSLGDTQRGGRYRQSWRRSGPEPADGCARDGRCAQPGVGGDVDGLPARLDFPGWPAGRGAEQYDYEPPRVVPGKSVAGRTARIKMLGNAVVPQQAAVLFEAIAEIERTGTTP